MNTDKTPNGNAVFCAPLEDSCMEGQAPEAEIGTDSVKKASRTKEG